MVRYKDVDHGMAAYIVTSALIESLDDDGRKRFYQFLGKEIRRLEHALEHPEKTWPEPTITSPQAVLELVRLQLGKAGSQDP